MSAALWVARWYVRRRWTAMIPFVAVLTAGLAAALIAVTTAARTDRAWDRYVARADVADLLINPSLQTAEIDATIRGLPGVSGVVTDDMLYAAVGRFDTVDEALADPAAYVLVTGSADGRYTKTDRLVFRAGRAPTGNDEAVISAEVADQFDIRIGDELPITFASIRDDIRAIYLDEQPTVGVIGVETPTVVGVATFVDEILPDGLYQHGRAVVSANIVERYSCMPAEVAPGASLEQAIDELAPAQCATSYRYWSLHTPPDDDNGQRTLDALTAAIAERNAALAPVVTGLGVEYVPIVTTTAETGAQVDRTMRPTTVALLAVGLAAAAVTLLVAGLVLARALQHDRAVRVVWNDVGMSPRQCTTILAGVTCVAALVGCALAALIALLVRTRATGTVGVLERSRPLLEDWAWWLLAGVAASMLGVAVALSARASIAATRNRLSALGNRRTPVAALPGPPDLAIGAREALPWQRQSMFTWLGSVVAFAALAATAVFGSSLAHLVSSPAAYGWPWELANVIGAGYGGAATVDSIAESLDGDARIDDWTALGLVQGFTVQGVNVPMLIGFDAPAGDQVVVRDGRLPAAAGEIALGTRTASDLSVGIGDEVALAGEGLSVDRAEVTGIVVLPSIGPYQADSATPGDGALIHHESFDAGLAESVLGFVGIDVAAGTDVGELRADLDDDFRSWEFFSEPRTLTDPVRPPEIVNSSSIRSVPVVIGVLVATAIVTAFMAAMYFSARARRRELAILRTLGFTNRQLRRSLRAQSVITALVTCGVGSLLGIALGRLAWRAFAEGLGVVPDPTVSIAVIASVVLAAAVLGWLAAIAPGRHATRVRVGEVLRST